MVRRRRCRRTVPVTPKWLAPPCQRLRLYDRGSRLDARGPRSSVQALVVEGASPESSSVHCSPWAGNVVDAGEVYGPPTMRVLVDVKMVRCEPVSRAQVPCSGTEADAPDGVTSGPERRQQTVTLRYKCMAVPRLEGTVEFGNPARSGDLRGLASLLRSMCARTSDPVIVALRSHVGRSRPPLMGCSGEAVLPARHCPRAGCAQTSASSSRGQGVKVCQREPG